MKKLFNIVLVCSIALMCFSCYYNEYPEVEEVTIDPEEDVSFTNNIIPIFTTYNCTQCHNGSQDPDLTSGNQYNSLVPDYVTAGNADASLLYAKLQSTHNNIDVDAESLAYIKEWINRGADPN